jgi:Bacteriophage lambda head decoration protein D
MVTLTEALHPGAFIISEGPHNHDRDAVSFAQSQTIVTGQVLGRRIQAAAAPTSSAAADASNTGNGTFTLDATAPVAQAAKDGNYRVVCILAGASAEFEVVDPSGAEIGRVAVGATFNNQIKFVVAAGGTNFAAGDAFTVTVGIADSNYEYAALNESATDGTQSVAGIAFAPITTTSANVVGAAITRGPMDVRASNLTWPSGASAAQIAEGLRSLERLGIVAR